MKRANRCPKCQSNDIVKVFGGISLQNYIIGFIRNIKIDRYICCKCGYSEQWIPKRDLYKAGKKYKKYRIYTE